MLNRIVALVVLAVASAAQGMTVIPSDAEHVKSLDGIWHFKLEQPGGYPEKARIGGRPFPIEVPKQLEKFEASDYREDAAWKELKVPGNWEMAGFSPATYNQPDNAIGLYRLELDVPAAWEGRVVKVNFDGVQNGAEVYLNGQPVNVDEASWGRPNYHEGGWTAFQADLTPAVKFGQKNLLALRVYKNTKSVDLDSGDYFLLGGIHRTVTLFSVPKTHVEDLTVQTTLKEGGKAEVRVRLDVAAGGGTSASMQLEGRSPIDAKDGGDGKLELVQVLDSPKLWSAEHPNLYNLTVELKDAVGKPIERITRRIGVREVSIKDGVLLLNGVPVKLAGMCRHDVSATQGTAVDEALWRKDVAMMKAANVNAIRTSHYPYGSGFYDVCDELGMYVMDEVAACWTPTDTDELTPAFQQHARETARRDKNHACVLVWAIGNENQKGKNNKLAAAEVRKIDPTRPRLVSWRDAEEGGVEIDDRHYTTPADIEKAAKDPRRAKYPMTYLENPNNWEMRNAADMGNWELWAPVIDRVWKVVADAEHIPGTFEWEWVDRAVADRCETKLYDFFPATGISLAKVKGLVDGFRNPRPGVYDIKMAYAPIKVDPKPQVSGSAIVVHARNDYSFTDLSELKTTWQLLRDGSEKAIASDAATAALKPRTHGELRLNVPADALAQADSLRISFDHTDGGNVATYELRLKDERESTPQMSGTDLSGVKFPRFNLVAATYGSNAIGWRTAARHSCKLVNVTVKGAAVKDADSLYAMPLTDVPVMEADVVLNEDAAGKVGGHVRATFADGKFSYELKWLQPLEQLQPGPRTPGGNKKKNALEDKADVQELGWAFEMPAAVDHFSWHRHGYWSYYPADNINRLTGTATPDSANVDVTKMDRPDAFDFNSTKYRCDWATLADQAGRGIVVAFAPEARGHVKAGTAADGGRLLVVNRYCCPPRDISSNVVNDEYFTLEKGQTVSGGFVIGTCGTK
jgi:beta-galactosidase